MPPLDVIALADQVGAHLARGDLAGLGPVELPPAGLFDAEVAARIVLADVAHCTLLEPEYDHQALAARWWAIAEQLGCLQRAALGRARAAPRRRARARRRR